MRVTLKLYASLQEYLPAGSKDFGVAVEVEPGITPHQLLDRYNVPRKLVHLVVRNGVYVLPAERERAVFGDGDVLAVWPPVAGG
jgi:sulfur carrier protein ThiS